MSYANRGMAFETLIEMSCQMYERQGKAIINKRPTPVKILGTNSKGMIHGFMEKPSTVDYDGTYQGRSIVFEAKSTKELTRFDLKNIQEHQYIHLEKSHHHGAISFVLIEFSKQRTVYLLPFETLRHYWTAAQKKGGRKSIPIDDMDVHAHRVEQRKIPVDFLGVVERVWENEEIGAINK